MNFLQSSLILLSLLAVSRSVPFNWQMVGSTSPPPPSRSNAGVVVYENYLYTFGGEGLEQQPASPNASTIRSDMWRIQLNGGNGWEDITSQVLVRPPAQYGFISGLIDDHWIISHGCGANDVCFSDTWAFDFNTLRWQMVNVTPPMEDAETDEMPTTMMMNVTSVSIQLNMTIVNDTDLMTNMSNITELMADNETLGDYFPSARRNTAGGIYPGTTLLWLSMGVSEDGRRRFSDTWVLNISIANLTGEWQLVSRGVELNQYDPFRPHARSHLAGTPLAEDTFAIFGGCASGGQVGGPCPMQDAWRISLEEREWVELPQCPSPRNGATMIALPGSPSKAILWGGNEAGGPGVFPQKISGPDYNSSFIYVLDLGVADNATWARNLAGVRLVPRPREGVQFTEGPDGLYIYGGRTVETDPIFVSELWRLEGDGIDADNYGCPSPTFSFVHLHGTLMYLAWGLLLPLGALVGRYYRWTWPCGFILHVIFQSAGVLLTVAGFVVIFLVGAWDQPNFPHAIVGIVLTGFLILQYLTGIFHPCVEQENGKTPFRDKSCYRVCWEIYHGFSGFVAIAIGFGQIMLGVFLVVPPMIVWIVWAGLGGLWVVVFFLHEIVYLACKIKNRNDE